MRGTPFGRYELLRKIAAGGMAEIYLARQWGDGGFFIDVVVKRMFHHLAEHEQTLRMFQYEALLLSELHHPNIPKVLDLGWAEGTWYMAMEHVEGQNVADTWRAGARAGAVMPLPVALGVVLQACEALEHAHERCDRAGRHLRIVHRDVTPHNLMITRDGVVKLMDFGIASTAARRDTEAGSLKGTFSYMSPEQVRARDVDRRADVFALGVILYELTTGTRLYRGNDVQIMTAIVEQDAPPPSARVPTYPPELESIVMSALRRNRDHRIASAGELARRLEHLALEQGLLIGRHAVSDYFNHVFPAQRVQEEELALVEPEPEPGVAEIDPDQDVELVEDDEIMTELDMLESPLMSGSGRDEGVPPPVELPGGDDTAQEVEMPLVRVAQPIGHRDDRAGSGNEDQDPDGWVRDLERRIESDGEGG